MNDQVCIKEDICNSSIEVLNQSNTPFDFNSSKYCSDVYSDASQRVWCVDASLDLAIDASSTCLGIEL